MRKNRQPSGESGLIKTMTFIALIAIIAVKVLRSVVMTLADAFGTVADSRNQHRK